MSPRALVGLFLLTSGCATLGVDSADASRPEPTEAERLQLKVVQVEQSLNQADLERTRRLWAHWFDGGSLAMPAEDGGRRAEQLAMARYARSLGVDAGSLERRLVADAVTALTRDAESEAAHVGATASFFSDGKEVALRDVARLLANEPSALRRKALLTASEEAARRESAAVERRDAARAAAFASLDAGPEAAWVAGSAGLSVEEAAALAAEVLDATDSALPTALELLARSELNLAPAVLQRADVPRLLKPPPTVDAAFPKAAVVERVRLMLTKVGWEKRVVIVESPHPLPLTLPGPITRIAYRAQGGLVDQRQLLSEAGAAVGGATASAAFGGLSRDRDWLASVGLSEGETEVVAAWADAAALVALRRAAAVAAFRFDVRPSLPEDQAQRWAALLTRALKIPHTDGARWPSETQGFQRALDLLVLHRRLAKLKPGWWAGPDCIRSVLQP